MFDGVPDVSWRKSENNGLLMCKKVSINRNIRNFAVETERFWIA